MTTLGIQPNARRTRNWFIGATLAVAMLVAGCADTETESIAESLAAPETSAPAVTESTTLTSPTTSAPGPMLDTIDGGQIDLGEVLGQDAVLWFWAPW